MVKISGRRQPYTARGIARVKCIRCPNKAHASWQICADGRMHRPLCKECDIELNEIVMRWAFGRRRERDLKRYAARVRETINGL